ncbi:hypothetical protein J132_11333 [Termitomyces sp. J132]|nr:hypothetical protein H2248_001828 [Termitomyces sp. 'cryptogamus']KNZ76213.1 hypothetical protein J132_11333 [Termitomyces sp. J132]
MEKASSVLAALDAGKLPSTQQLNDIINWLDHVGIASIESSSSEHLSSQGRLLSKRVREVLDAHKKLGLNKNGDNILQEAIWHLTQGDLETTGIDSDEVKADLTALRKALRTLLSIIWTSLSSESGSTISDFASFTRLSLADAAELVETSAASAKESLRAIEQDVQKGRRTSISGRDKKRVEEEAGDVKVRWEHGMDAVKGTGDSLIDAGRSVSSSVQEASAKTTNRVHDAYLKICERARTDSKYRDSIDTIISVLQKRIHQTLDASKSSSLASFVNDPTPEQHVPKALALLQTLLERLSSTPLEPLIAKVRICLTTVAGDPKLRKWFDDFFDLARKNLVQQGYVQSEESKKKRLELRTRWKALLDEEDGKWHKAVDEIKGELTKFQEGLIADKDLSEFKEAHIRLGQDIERGFVEASDKAETGLEALMERATWFWQDLFRIYVPRLVNFFSDLPIPRTEYKDSEIEFVLENLDISSLNLLPSHIYIRNITDVDITTASSPTATAQTAVGTLTRIKVDAVQLSLKDVSFWYKDLQASALSPGSFTGLLALTLPPQGISLDIKVRLIPHTIPSSSPDSRAARGHFHVVEHAQVSISEDVQLEIKESNHGVLLAMFKPIFVLRLRDALEKTLSNQVRAVIEWADAVAYDISRRREVFEDTGAVGGGTSLLAAIWSEIGRLKRESMQPETGVEWRATGTGVVVEQGGGDIQFAMGAEPQILSGDKRGPAGTASDPLAKRIVASVQDVTGVNVREAVGQGRETNVSGVKTQAKQSAGQVQDQLKGLARDGQKRIQTFHKAVEAKKVQEERKKGWRSDAFDV